MNIAKIVSSNSHIDYIARVHSESDMQGAPDVTDYGFGAFVSMDKGSSGAKFIAAVYDSQLINPEYANFGPRLSPKPQLEEFSPDFIDEQGVLLGLILLGTLSEDGSADQSLPSGIIMPGTDVHSLSDEDLVRFHTASNGTLIIHYYPQITQHAGSFAVPLLDAVIGKLVAVNNTNSEALRVLNDSLKWHNTFAGTRL